jgi:hypothetical protein
MIKKTWALLSLLMIFNSHLYAEDENPLIIDIGLIESGINNGLTPPSKLLIGIEMEKDAYYKLSDEKNVIKGGLFKRGLNFFNIEADNLFDTSGSHIYFLDLKTDGQIVREEIEINVRIDSEVQVKKTEAEIKETEYKLSLYIGDELVISSRKLPEKKAPMKINLPPWPETYSPNNPLGRLDSPLNSPSILDAIGVAYNLLKKLTAKKSHEKQEKPIQKLKQVSTTFFRSNLEGNAVQVKAVITLKTGE